MHMQTSMGLAASSLLELLDMPSEVHDGDQEENFDKILLQARKDLTDAMSSAGDHGPAVNKLLQLQCPVTLKYVQLSVGQMLKDNCESILQIKTIPPALSILEKYGRHLLKPRERRAELWRQIKFSNAIFKDRVLPMKGALDVVRQMGYTLEIEDGLQFDQDEPDPVNTSKLVADIVLARAEMERYLSGTHPHPEMISSLLPPTILNQLQAMWSYAPVAGAYRINQEPSLSAQKVLSQPVQVSAGAHVLQENSVHPLDLTELPSNEKSEPHLDDSIRRACDICGNRPAEMWCQACDNKQLCDACDDMWHKHPKRLNHPRESITSLPSPSASTTTGVNIQGPFGIRAVDNFGIRAVDNLKYQPSSPKQISADDSTYGSLPAQGYGDSSDHSQNLQIPVDAASSLLQHQQQLHHYHQILQQQQFDRMPEYPSSHYQYYPGMIRSPPQQPVVLPVQVGNSTGKGQGGNHLYQGLLAQNISHPENAAFLRYTTLPPYSAADPSMPSYLGLTGINQQSLNVMAVQMARDPSLTATNTFTGGGQYNDFSLRRSVPSTGTFEGPTPLGPMGVTEPTSFLVGAGKSSRSALSTSLSGQRLSSASSPLLSRVLAESNYEKRDAKCAIQLMTLTEELRELELALNALMLNNDDFCELEEFRSLNKRKALLMREHNILSQYKEELAKIMQSGVYGPCKNDLDASSEVFHPPVLASASSVLVKPNPASSLMTQVAGQHSPQREFSQQTAQSPLKKQEHFLYPSHSPTHAQDTGQQSVFNQNGPLVLESVEASSIGGDSRSSVDKSSLLPQWKMVQPENINPPSVPGDFGLAVMPVCTDQQMVNHAQLHPVSSANSNTGGDTIFASQTPILSQATMGSNSIERPTAKDEILRNVSDLCVPVTQQGQEDRPPNWMPETGEAALQTPVVKPKMQQQLHSGKNVPSPRPPPISSAAPLSMKVPAAPPGRFKPPEESWQCNHCTLINSPGTRVCMACDRTSDNPTLISSGGSSENDLQSGSLRYGEKLDPSLPAHDSASSAQIEKLYSKLAEEQDRVYLEKKEAQQRYSTMMTQDVSGEHRQSTPPLHQEDMITGSMVQPQPSVAKKPSPNASQGTRLSPVDTVAGFAAEHQAYSDLPEGRAVTRLRQVSPENGGSSTGSGDSSSFITEGNFQQTMERFSEQKKIKQMQIDGLDVLHFLKMADRQGFDFSEMNVALEKCGADCKGALAWLRTEWEKSVGVVMSTAKSEGQRSQHNDVGELSREEALTALRECGGDLVPAVKKCTAKRKALYAQLNPDGTFAREEVLQAMLQCKGDEEAVRQHLHKTLLQPLLERVWQGTEEVELGGAVGLERSLLQMAIAETCQSVSTSVISHEDFQQKIKDKNVDRERRIRMVLAEGKLRSWGRAELVIKLLDHDLPAAYTSQGIVNGEDYHCTLEDVVEAVRNCEDKRSALVYLMQECQICFSHYPMSKIRNLNFCQCKICSDCLKQNFEVVIREKHVRHWTCPLCSKPDLNDEDLGSEYINFLGMLLQMQVDKEVYDLFETKVRDWYLQKDPNFRWCAHCGNGFIADRGQLKMVCPHCSQKTCYQCKKQWEEQHDGLTCEQFAQWKIDNDPNNQAVGLARHLEENGIDCPSCKMRYALAKGGCMHFKCPQCGHEFCSGCYQPFYQRGMCTRLKNCKMNGLHAHHPRDCFFYLRDYDVRYLQELLEFANVEFNTVPPTNQEDADHCPVIEQKEFDAGKRDESCGKQTEEGLAGLCLLHYKEYLVGLINKNKVDPAVSMNIEDLKKVLARGEVNVPKQKQNELPTAYLKRIIKLVQEKMPLPLRPD